jgi:hypothetical protein
MSMQLTNSDDDLRWRMLLEPPDIILGSAGKMENKMPNNLTETRGFPSPSYGGFGPATGHK